MIKDTVVNSTLTPSGNADLVDAILGRVVEPQTRWSPGSLVSSILSESSTKQLILITAGQVIAFSQLGAYDSDILANLGGDESYIFGALESSTKSKVLNAISVQGVSSYPVQSTFRLVDGSDAAIEDEFLIHLLAAVTPSYTALSAINRIENYFFNLGTPYLIYLDQDSEQIGVLLYGSDATILDRLADLQSSADFETHLAVNVAFITTAGGSSGPDTPAFGWE